ncbi:hypothetical protein FKW77_004374 [Venturia effusa]|uniref:Uncharacterized protein n=1 Tax=Venturia effusa TaxID=50376 RepID=A0A517LAX0_9PEZI|nr:hypothetical protein FKW77_004374 [Venturia effusa]
MSVLFTGGDGKRRGTQAAKQPRTYVGDLERARDMEGFRPGRRSPLPESSTTQAHSDDTRAQEGEQQDSDISPPPRSAKRLEGVSGPSSLTSQQARHLQDLQLDEVCRHEAREGKKSLENRRQAEKEKAFDEAGDVEKQDEDESRDKPEPDPNRYRPFSGSKTFNRVFDWIAMSLSFYIGVVFLAVFLATTLYFVLKPPQALEIMRLDTKHVFSGGNYSNRSFIAQNCGYELLPPGSHLASNNASDVGRHRPLRLNRGDANISISGHIELYMFGSCYNGFFGRQCAFGNPLLPLNWNITRIVENSIKPTFNGLDEVVKSELVNAALKEEYVKEISQKVAKANPDPAKIDMLAWGWPMPVWPKPSSFSLSKSEDVKRTVLLLNQHVFDGEVRTGDVTSTYYGVILVAIVAGICILGIIAPFSFSMGPGERVNYVPWWVGYSSVGVPFAVLAIVGISLENGVSGWSANRCSIVEHSGSALRPFWIRDYLQWYFGGLVVLFGAFALAYLTKGIFSKHSLVDTRNIGSWGFVGFWILSFLALLTALVTGQRSMKTKAQAINSISDFLGMRAVPGKGYWIALCVAEFLALWTGLAFLFHSLNVKFRERKDDSSCRSSKSTTSETSIMIRSGARSSAPLLPLSSGPSREKPKTFDAIPEEIEIDRDSAERSASASNPDVELTHGEDTDKIAENEEGNGSDDQSLNAESVRRSKDKCQKTLEVPADKEQSEYESGVARSSMRESPSSRATHDGTSYYEEQDDEEEGGDVQDVGDEYRDHLDGVDEDGHGVQPDINSDSVRDQGREDSDELQDQAGPIHDRRIAETDKRWSCHGETARRVSGYRPRSSASEGYQQSERYDAASESSRGGTPLSRLDVQRDGVSGRLRYLTERGHVFDMVERLSRNEDREP